MTKRKILALALTLSMVAILAIGGTLAYFTDTDAQTNVFTTGNVAIDLFEDFGDNDGTENLVPAVGTQSDDNPWVTEYENTVEKEVYVENTGSEEAYVRVHIALPQVLNAEGKRIINTICNDQSTVEGKWSWGKVTEGANYNGLTEFNRYFTELNGVSYSVFVLTYETALNNGDVTVDAISKVYMDPATTQQEIAEATASYGDDWKKIYVVAEATQADGFETAHEALDEAFGVPGTYGVSFGTAAEGKTWVETTSVNGD